MLEPVWTNSALSRAPLKMIAAVATLSACSSVPAQAPSPDETQALTLVSSVMSLVDNRCFSALQPHYARSVTTDYTSLWGGEPRTLTRREVASGWAGFLPGFDSTHHRLIATEARTQNDTIQVLADIEATHWLGTEFWWIAGTYDIALRQDLTGGWQISQWTFNLTDERGDRQLVDEAERRSSGLSAICALGIDTSNPADTHEHMIQDY